MKEKNYDRLRRALDQLPDYGPDDQTWEHIQGGLDAPRVPLAEQLPTYAPPAQVWNALSRELPPAGRRRLSVVRQAGRRVAALAAAAMVALLVAAGLYLRDEGPEVTYAYYQEAAPAPVVADWDEDEDSFDRAREVVQQRNEPRLNHLGQELDELTSAREEVKAMLVAYGEDPSIVRQLAEIERERDDVYRRIIVEL
ncbi:hypothetical protein GGR26_003441 [Lewinella marina]|uniref:Uncharacterized protein n=1 Tax=Neolewinella marina TaxID=438751 RepID=A0A2G0CCD7_9BACT|nr:hypothetical protein [Neolewinella marina]NJB87657.1 hypothetical protein [Neolewinella marina]PHK97659.1 hypothetical protein CGL56_14605 [Neolewinella marina]